jgi:hypothetical protein
MYAKTTWFKKVLEQPAHFVALLNLICSSAIYIMKQYF